MAKCEKNEIEILKARGSSREKEGAKADAKDNYDKQHPAAEITKLKNAKEKDLKCESAKCGGDDDDDGDSPPKCVFYWTEGTAEYEVDPEKHNGKVIAWYIVPFYYGCECKGKG